MNSLYFLPMNIGGDGKNVHPYLGPIKVNGDGPANDNLHFDLAKLEQWGVVFEHAQRGGIMLHFVLNEAEQQQARNWMTASLVLSENFFIENSLAASDMLPALQWNISEEYNLQHYLKPELVKEFAQYIGDLDPYGHPITVHHAGRAKQGVAARCSVTRGFQSLPSRRTRMCRRSVENLACRVAKNQDFPSLSVWTNSFPKDKSQQNVDRHRREYLWPVYLSGGQIEFILDELLKVDDFRKYELLWRTWPTPKPSCTSSFHFGQMEP